MSTSPESCVKNCIQEIKETFDGFGQEAVEEVYNIMIKHVREAFKNVKREAMAAAAQASGEQEPEKPPLKRLTNYTMFGMQFRKDHPEIKEDMFKRIGEAWNGLSADERAEWKSKADEENTRLKEEYRTEHGEPPKRGRRKRGPKTTNPFQVFVAEFRSKNPKVGHREVFGEASKAWKKLAEKKRQPYVDEAAKLREQFRTEWEEEQKNNPQPAQAAGGKKKRPKKLRPKTKSGYILFGNHWRTNENKDGLNGKESMSAVGAAWKALSEKDRAKYQADADKENKQIVASFLKENPDSEWARSHAEGSTATA